jgi:hypothetical protein
MSFAYVFKGTGGTEGIAFRKAHHFSKIHQGLIERGRIFFLKLL